MVKIRPLVDVKSSNIGKNTSIWQFCVAFAKAQIDDNYNLCAKILIENDVVVGNNATIK